MTLRSSVAATVEADRVEFEYEVENVGDDPEEVTFRSGLSADFAVLRDGEEVWRASEGRMFTQALRTETIDAGATETFSGAWDDPDPGDYTVVATLNATGDDAEARAEFSV
ncbi:BsuPI-related putative proteinase inhibitor [Halorussus salilacus]|uniref:BsuPI-related putative proteinase inhibitor n=1 Tax=Halorussus salilacus TaxID=2953750 RepID=UPI00209D92C7|nr:BsuPI-related putative proteinase inhibitor [Halorussus salilacus]USZ67913.1 BsuPI-related putative proteinase inhibitor [Halorussus salilacus]